MVWRSVITLLLISAPLSLCIDEDIISQNPKCKADFEVLKDICGMTSEQLNSNLAALYCIHKGPLGAHLVSDQCLHHLWEMKLEITIQDKFLLYAKKYCKIYEDLLRIEECYRFNKKKHWFFVTCMVNNMPGVPPVHDMECEQFIYSVEHLIFSDYPLLAGLIQKCNASITKLNCGRVRMESIDPNSQNPTIACLSEKFEDVEDDCKYEIVRKAELDSEVQHRDGRVYECLLRYKMEKEMGEDCRQQLTRRQKQAVRYYKEDLQLGMEEPQGKELNSAREKSVNELVAETQMESEWKADPVLKDACEELVMTACNPKAGSVAVMSCLVKEMSKQGGVMNNDCRSVLLQLHYFLAREVLLDENLYTKCKADATRLCGAQEVWHNQDKDPRHKLVFSCLVRNIYNDEDEKDDNNKIVDPKELQDNVTIALTVDCANEVERVLQQRAVSVHLHPEIEDACRYTLHQECIAHIGPGEEIQCLQDNMETLPSGCKTAIVKYTKLEVAPQETVQDFFYQVANNICPARG